MSNTPNRQNQDELLQHIAAIHEHKPSHRRDLSIEAMTEDLDRITGSPNHAAGAGGKSFDINARIDETCPVWKGVPDCTRGGEIAIASSSIAGEAGSQQGNQANQH